MMTKDELRAFWLYGDMLKKVPEKDFENPNPRLANLINAYGFLSEKFGETVAEMNGHLDSDGEK